MLDEDQNLCVEPTVLGHSQRDLEVTLFLLFPNRRFEALGEKRIGHQVVLELEQAAAFYYLSNLGAQLVNLPLLQFVLKVEDIHKIFCKLSDRLI